jgi:hypothetical protein
MHVILGCPGDRRRVRSESPRVPRFPVVIHLGTIFLVPIASRAEWNVARL